MRVLVFVKYYLPAYKAGGPLKSIQGLVDYFGEDIEFSVVAGDRDYGDEQPFPDVEIGRWTKCGDCRVFYTNQMNNKVLAEILQDETWDLLYLQSFFDPQFTIKPLLWWKFGKIKAKQLLVAPRGEFSPGAVQLKAAKKRIYLTVAKWLNFYKGAFWQASSEREKQHILQEISSQANEDNIFVASDIPPKPLPVIDTNETINKDCLRILHLSRVTEMKNLEFVLQTLSELSFPIELNICGPVDAPDYWQRCQEIIKTLPKNIHVNYLGPVEPPQVPQKFASHDVFFLPTRGENFGHVVFESLQNGCPVLISDQTPWQDLGEKKVGWVYPLDDMKPYRQVLSDLHNEPHDDREQRRQTCTRYAEQFISSGDIASSNRLMFESLQNQL